MECNMLFFGDKNLKGYTYYYYLPHISFLLRKELSDKITQCQGKITFTLNSQSILIIQELKDMQSKEFMEEIRAFGDISFYHNKQIINIQHNRSINNEILRCILLSDLLAVLTIFEQDARLFTTFTSHGLPQNTNKDALIALLLPRDVEKKAHYHEFQLCSNGTTDKWEYDIPRYIPSIPFNFGVFCSNEEKTIVEEYMNQCNNNNGKNGMRTHDKDKDKDKDNNDIKRKKELFETPEPYKEHTYCHLCKQKYREYFSHVQSLYHQEIITNNKKVFDRITNTFDRMKAFWQKEKVKEQKILEEERTQNLLSNQSMLISIPIPDNIKVLLQFDKPSSIINNSSYSKKIPLLFAVTNASNDIIPPHPQNVFELKKEVIHSLIQDTSQTQYNTNISGDTNLIKTIKNEKRIYAKRKYDQMRIGNYSALGENKHYLRTTAPPRILSKASQIIHINQNR